MLRKVISGGLIVLLSVSVSAADASFKYPYKVIDTYAKSHFVHFDAEKLVSRKDFNQVGKAICRKSNMCIVMFWEDKALVPSFLPMTGAQLEAKKAHYVINRRTKFERLILCESDDC